MAEAAKVIRIAGNGAQRLLDAVQSGMLSVDAERAYREVLEDNERLRKENRQLKEDVRVLRAMRKQEQRCRVEAYRMVFERNEEYRKVRDWRYSIAIGLMALGGLILAVSTIVAMM